MTYPTKKLGEVLELCDAGTWGDESPAGMPLLRSTNMQNGQLVLDDVKYILVPKEKADQYTLREGDILITKSSGSIDHIGKSLFITKEMDGKYGFSNFTQRLRINRKIFLPEWVYLKVSDPGTRSFLLGASQTTTGLRNLKISALKELEIPMPPVEEQRKIVAKIEKQFAKIDEVVRLRAESQALAGQLLPAALHEIFSSAESKGWQEVVIGDKKIMQMTSGGTPSRSNSKFYGGKIAWLKSGELNDNTQIENSEEHITNEALQKSSAKVFPSGTVLLAMYGATAGKLGILAKSAATNQAVAGLTPNAKYLDSKFLYYCLSYIREQIVDQAWGGAQPNLSQTILKTFKIPLPLLTEQKKIVKKLDALAEKARALRDLQSSQSADLKTLKQSILHETFN